MVLFDVNKLNSIAQLRLAFQLQSKAREVSPNLGLQILWALIVAVVPGKQIYTRALEMKLRDADKIVFASCITKRTPDYLGVPSPFASKLKKIIEEKVEIGTIDGTH